MTALALHSIERQVSRRATTLNQAWSWAYAVRHLSLKRSLGRDEVALSHLQWLECEMTWICEDLEDAGAWTSDVELPVVDDPELAKTLCRQMLERLVKLPDSDCDCRTALIDAQLRSDACLRALAEEPAESVDLRLAAA